MTEHRYTVQHGQQRGYVVWDTLRSQPAFTSDSKSEVISEAQRRNGFEPIDGSEATYAKQKEENQ